MAKLSILVTVLVLALFHKSQSFVPNSRPVFGVVGNTNQRITNSRLFAGESDKEGGAAIAKPKIKTDVDTKTKQKQKQQVKKKNKVHDPISRRDEEFQDAPMYKLMLIGDESYDPTHVVERMCAIIDDMDEDQASEVFKQANINGKAMCGKFPFERAELFKEQLQRSDPMIFSDMEEENA